jgi:hypothetical protein
MSDFEIPAERDLPRGHLERRASYLVRELAASRRRRRLMLSLVPAVAVLLVGSTGFTAYTLFRTEPTHYESVGCYDRADLGSNVAVVDAQGRGPLAACRGVWRQGALGSPVPERLAACVLDTGPIGVFPSSDDRTCERLGLADLSAAALQESARFVRLREAIFARIGVPPSGSSRGSSRCVGADRAGAIVREELNARGYSDWKVEAAGEAFTSQRPCAEVSFDGGSKTVLLVAGTRR